MRLSSLQLEAFIETARALHFSRAAKTLGLTQSALSQRIRNLETELGVSLFVRAPSGVRLTEEGQKMHQYALSVSGMESDFLSAWTSGSDEALGGTLRVGTYSSLGHSVVMPALSPLLLAHPRVRIELIIREVRDLPALLRSAEIDFLLLNRELAVAGVNSRHIGEERNILIESTKKGARTNHFLDHDAEDVTTQQFLKASGSKGESIERSYLDDINGIIEGVRLGWGSAVVPEHLIRRQKGIRRNPRYKAHANPVWLHWLQRPFYGRLNEEALTALSERCSSFLGDPIKGN